MNIWTHIFGFFLLFFLTINDLVIINIHATIADKIVAGLLFSCFLVSEVSIVGTYLPTYGYTFISFLCNFFVLCNEDKDKQIFFRISFLHDRASENFASVVNI